MTLNVAKAFSFRMSLPQFAKEASLSAHRSLWQPSWHISLVPFLVAAADIVSKTAEFAAAAISAAEAGAAT
jgi:hypothetical protein